MQYFLVPTLIVLCSLSFSCNTDSRLPVTWTKDFTITLNYGGSMDGSSTHLVFTYDTCTYTRNSGMELKKESVFVLTESERSEILEKMRELKADRIRSERRKEFIHDGWSGSICFNDHCIESGTMTKMSDTDRERYSKAYDYLENVARKKDGE